MAYNRSQRFPTSQKCCMLLDPGAYQRDAVKVTQHKVPFLSQTPRKTAPVGSLWTHAIYDIHSLHKIPNCSSLKSKCPRFPYETFSKEELNILLCRCGVNDECECPIENEEEKQKSLCQGKVCKRIIIGPTPRCGINKGLPVPSEIYKEMVVLPTVKKHSRSNIHQNLTANLKNNECQMFYNTNVYFSTDFYRGCKWSKQTEKRSMKSLEDRVGPTNYFYIKEPTEFELCAEKYREYKRLTSKQLRFIEMVQSRNILEGLPGPGSYNPEQTKGYQMQYLGPKAKRFPKSKFDQLPGPAEYHVKRTFDRPKLPDTPCHAKLPEKSFFGVKAQRFKPIFEEGPSPATYNTTLSHCHFMQCPTAPFGSSSKRFKESSLINEEVEDDMINTSEIQETQIASRKECRYPTWMFNSKTIRMKHLKKNFCEPSPADMPQNRSIKYRSQRLQYFAPFWTSEGRFQPWKDWMPVYCGNNTPGPCYYEWEKPKCFPAVTKGPLQRSERFPQIKKDVPAPNKYKLGGGIESILSTHNFKLKENIKKQHIFKWKRPIEIKELSYEEREKMLLNKSIALLDIDVEDQKKEEMVKVVKNKDSTSVEEMENRKFLRSFVYGQEMPHCI